MNIKTWPFDKPLDFSTDGSLIHMMSVSMGHIIASRLEPGSVVDFDLNFNTYEDYSAGYVQYPYPVFYFPVW